MYNQKSAKMELKKLHAPLGIKDIDFRVQSINKGGFATILAYKDARVDMNRLDEVCGAENWQRDHKEIKGVVYGGIGIMINGNWVWKWDAGAESNTEKEKGEASDSFKRAGFNWGIGRELYDYPIIQVKLNEDEFEVENGRARQTWNLKLKAWTWYTEFNDDGTLRYLGCKDNHGKVRFTYGEIQKTAKRKDLDK
jgi:hypothetical protein